MSHWGKFYKRATAVLRKSTKAQKGSKVLLLDILVALSSDSCDKDN